MASILTQKKFSGFGFNRLTPSVVTVKPFAVRANRYPGFRFIGKAVFLLLFG